MHIAVIGLGYVGSVSGACLASMGHTVFGVDRDALKVDSVRQGRAPFYEPGLDELVQKNVAEGRLRATTELAEALAGAEVAIVCVGTPSDRNGNLGLDQMRRVCAEIGNVVRSTGQPLVLAIRSTVFPGTCREVIAPAIGETPGISLVSNPEFLREGVAVKDFMDPAIIVVGGDDPSAVGKVASLYASLPGETACVRLETAEMIKYACNAFHALKISFANEVGALCGKLHVPAAEVMSTLCKDTRLNTSAAYLKPGFAFGGSCLPKDLRALNYRTARLDLHLPVLDSVLNSNLRHLMRALQAVMDLPPGKTGIYGLAFKENTDDLRESPVVILLEQLLGKGIDLRVYDPYVRIQDIHGSNRTFLMETIPHIARTMTGSLDELLAWSDHLVLAQKPADDVAARLRAWDKPVLDLVGALVETPNAFLPR